MESSINSTNVTNMTELLEESYYDDVLADVSLVATYLWFLILLISIPATIIPPAVIIHIIRKTEELHTNYSLFLVNLLIGDILITISYCFGGHYNCLLLTSHQSNHQRYCLYYYYYTTGCYTIFLCSFSH